MEMLALEKRRAIHMIREELCCKLCGRVFDDPQCLDCKHNFCRECILLHMRKTDSSCPKCKLPTRPSEITRNQFLQSILSAWKAVEQALAPLEDPNSATILEKQEQQELEESQRQQREEQAALASRGPVASNKWNINTTELRQEAHEEARRANNTALFGGSLAQRAAIKSAALDAKNAQAAASQQSMMDASQTQMSSVGQLLSPSPKRAKAKKEKAKASHTPSQVVHGASPQTTGSSLSSLSSPFGLMATQDVEGLMKKIQGQNRFLDEWAQSSKKKASMVQLPITGFRTAGASPTIARVIPTISAVQRVQELMNAATSGLPMTTSVTNRSPGKRKRQIFAVDEDSDDEEDDVEEPDDPDDDDYEEPGAGRSQTQTQTQMPGTLGESPDLLGFGGVAPPVKASALGPVHATVCRQDQQFKARRVNTRDGDDEEDKGDEDSEEDEETAWAEPPAHSPRVHASPKRSHKRAQSPAPRTPTRSSPRKRLLVPPSQLTEVVDMTMGDEDDEDEDEDDEDAVEDSQLPTHLAVRRSKYEKRVSEDFKGAIHAFEKNAPVNGISPNSASRLHRLSGGNDPVFDSPPAVRSAPSSATKGISTNAQQPAKPTAPAVVTTPAALPAKPPLAASHAATTMSRRNSKNSDSPSSLFVFTGTDLTADESKRLLLACHRLGGRFGRDFDLKRDATTGELTTSVTHLVTKSIHEQLNLGLRCKRTAKYMRALAEGIFVVDYSWVEASLANGKWLPEVKYEMSGDIYSDAVGKPLESRIRKQRTGSRNEIFRQFQFVLLSPLHEFDFQVDSVRKIVVNFGATVEIGDDVDDALPKMPGRTNLGIVSKVMEPEYARGLLAMHRIPIVRVTWIFDSISNLEVLPFDDYYPY